MIKISLSMWSVRRRKNSKRNSKTQRRRPKLTDPTPFPKQNLNWSKRLDNFLGSMMNQKGLITCIKMSTPNTKLKRLSSRGKSDKRSWKSSTDPNLQPLSNSIANLAIREELSSNNASRHIRRKHRQWIYLRPRAK